jgi:hypothetical protein
MLRCHRLSSTGANISDPAYTFTPIGPSKRTNYGMHMRESVSFAAFKCAQMLVFVPQCIFRERPLHISLYHTDHSQ